MRSVTECCVADGRPPIEASVFPDGTQENLSVNTGRVEFNLQQPANTAYILRQNPDLEALPGAFVTDQAGYTGWIFEKGNIEFQDPILGAVNEMIADGTWTDVFFKYGVTENDILVPPMRNSERQEDS